MINHLNKVSEFITQSFNQQQLIKVSLGSKKNKAATLQNIFVKPITIKGVNKLCFTYRNSTNDIVKNFDLPEAKLLVQEHLQNDFFNVDIFTTTEDWFYSTNKNGKEKMTKRPASQSVSNILLQHDKPKQRIIDAVAAKYLIRLEITSAEGFVKKDKQDKFKQINHYIQIIEGIVKDVDFGNTISVADMGSGKGYLTFALYDYLTNKLKLDANVLGVELRKDLVEKCTHIANEIGYNNLHFKEGAIATTHLPNIDMLIALHACDTATDDAINTGIKANAKVIVCAPCCHKQIRKEMQPENELKTITKHGILLERQAEIVTDTIRALMLEANGYKTRVFDFIATEHTPKNVMIVAIKCNRTEIEKQESLDKITGLKKLFNIKTHYLETLLTNQRTSLTPQ